jgi:hypothetical protein
MNTIVVSSHPTQAIQHYVTKWLATSRWFSPGTPVSSLNKTDCHDITEILLKVTLNMITLTLTQSIKNIKLISQIVVNQTTIRSQLQWPVFFVEVLNGIKYTESIVFHYPRTICFSLSKNNLFFIFQEEQFVFHYPRRTICFSLSRKNNLFFII